MFTVRQAETTGGGPGTGPPLRLLLTEPARGLADLATLPVAAPWLMFAPRGDGHGVLVLPGLLASDSSTALLRQFLRLLGYQVRGWSLGRNIGPTEDVLDGLPAILSALVSQSGGPVSVVGWSLGGIYARELARRHAGQVREVITLGSPFALADAQQSHADRAYERRARLHATARVPTREEIRRPIPVASTAVYSRRDGIVSWQACIEAETDLHRNVEVRCAHLGFGVDPATLWLIADRLAVLPAPRREFRPPAALRGLYPARDQARSDQDAAAHRP